jgi:LysM repeat protein
MTRKPAIIIPVIMLTFLVSCQTARVPVTSGKTYNSAESYIEDYKDMAISEMRRTGVPASITLAQGIIESDMGRSMLAKEANNHFGIKCHSDWNGATVRKSDDRRNECFRKYKDPMESYKDHSDFLRGEQRYGSLFWLDSADYKGWARGLKKAGYATNPDYANMLIKKIEQYSLYNYDKAGTVYGLGSVKVDTIGQKQNNGLAVSIVKVSGNSSGNIAVSAVRPRVMEKNRVQYIIVKEGDTRESLETEFQLLKWELARYNELKPEFSLIPGQILYLQPKRERAETGKEFHTVSGSETMYSISQIYGIKLKNLLNMNRMTAEREPVTGQKIWLRSMKPVE